MNRRAFFKTMLATPLFTPLLLSSKNCKSGCELYLVADDPQWVIMPILKKLRNYGIANGRRVCFLNPHPNQDELKQSLSRLGWSFVQKSAEAEITLSFCLLRHKSSPSFTLVKEGQIWDIRSRKLDSLWKEINKNHKPTSLLTIASFNKRQGDPFPGEYVSVYKNGQEIEQIWLDERLTKTYRARKGKIAVCVERGKAWISGSSCSHKVCLYTPPVTQAGERIICAPNHFLLEVQGPHSVDTVIG